MNRLGMLKDLESNKDPGSLTLSHLSQPTFPPHLLGIYSEISFLLLIGWVTKVFCF